MYFFRKICSPLLAQLLAREIRNSKFIQKGSSQDVTLYKTLTGVHSGRTKMRNNQEKAKGTHSIDNLKDKNNQEILEQVKTKELLMNGEDSEAVSLLGKLDVKFLLCVLINRKLDITFKPEVRKALEELLELRNSSIHRDGDKDLLTKLWDETKHIHVYLGKDPISYDMMKGDFCYPEEAFKEILSELTLDFLNLFYIDAATDLMHLSSGR